MATNRNEASSFFAREQQNPSNISLITSQIDPTQPQITGLERVSDPIIPADHSTEIVKNFDPELYDLKYSSHIMRLIRAFTGASGIGGLRKQMTVSRLASTITGANFVDLDRFYGALFNFRRQQSEVMPTNTDGTTVNPFTDVAPLDVWDDVQSRDARFRSRLHAMARALTMGGTYAGLKGVAEAILGSEVDLIESWVKVDAVNDNQNLTYPTGLTYGQMKAQFVTWGQIKSHSYAELAGDTFGVSDLAFGNRGELIFTPRRIITAEERYQLLQVLRVLKPSNTQITIAQQQNATVTPVPIKALAADSENWQIQSHVTPAIGLINPVQELYPNADNHSVARPVFSNYTGESWSYNANITHTTSYRLNYEQVISTSDNEIIIYQDNVSHTYAASDGVMDSHQAISNRLSGEGITTNFPYTDDRQVQVVT